MIKFYLITGFLGAGKTTFLKKFIPSLVPMRMHLVINEFGKESVDGSLLEVLDATMKQINNGSIFCTCKLDTFAEELLIALDSEPDCIIVEASGLADPTNIRAIINNPKYEAQLDYAGTICLVDAVRFKKVYTTARCVKKQIASSDVVLLNKTDKADKSQIEETESLVKTQRPDIPIYHTAHGNFDFEWLKNIDFLEDKDTSYEAHIPDISLQKILMNIKKETTYEQLMYFLKEIADETYRVKGFVNIEGELLLVNNVGTMIEITPYKEGNETNVGKLVILSGQGLPIRKAIKKSTEHYSNLFTIVRN